MSATVKPNPNGGHGWVAYCPEHSATMTGSMADTGLWADVHNAEKHPADLAETHFGCPDCGERYCSYPCLDGGTL